MELQQLKTFTTIAKIGSFTRAAEVLDYAQSSISAQVRALEDELETKLFERLGREVSLTEAGQTASRFRGKTLETGRGGEGIRYRGDRPPRDPDHRRAGIALHL